MCGIVATVGVDPSVVMARGAEALTAIAHRGPDDEGTWTDGCAWLGNRRLSIIDLTSGGHQPMIHEPSGLLITYNGEIYNYVELRAELEAAGHSFKTQQAAEASVAPVEVGGQENLGVRCAVVLDVFSRRVVGWSIDSTPTAALVTNALGMAIEQRGPDGSVIHSDQGSQFTSWAFTRRALDSGLMPSMGSVGDSYDNAVIESFWSRMQVELLDRRRWRIRVELANAIFDYLEIFHNRQRRHSALGMLTPVEFESRHKQATVA